MTRGGYGQINYMGRPMGAHRLAHEAWVGPIPDGMFVCHKCDNPPCINPAHLFAGTPADNWKDCWSKGRAYVLPTLRGDESPNARLTSAQVAEIRERLLSGESQTEIGRHYGVGPTAIYSIREGRSWTA